MNILKVLTLLAFGSALLTGCGANEDESATQADTPSPAVETPASSPEDTMSPADTTVPSDEADPAMSDTLPTDEQPPPPEPAPPPGN